MGNICCRLFYESVMVSEIACLSCGMFINKQFDVKASILKHKHGGPSFQTHVYFQTWLADYFNLNIALKYYGLYYLTIVVY